MSEMDTKETTMTEAITVQFEVWRNGRMVGVKEKTFASDVAMARFFEKAEADGRDLQPLRYSR